MKIKKLKSKIKGLTLFCGVLFFACNAINVQAAPLTEQQAKEKAAILLEEEKERGDEFAVLTYDIEDLYACEYQAYIIHDYRSGKSFPEMIDETHDISQTEREEQKDVVRTWKIPYQNYARQNCLAIFMEKNGTLSLVGGELDVDSTFDMKIKDERFDEISMEDVEEVRYVELYLYHFMVTYVRMEDGTEYIIPYLNDAIRRFNLLNDGEVYEIDEFFEQMYNYYDEPTKAELQKEQEEFEKTGIEQYGSGVNTREIPLDQMNQASLNLKKSAAYGVISLGAVVTLIVLLKKWRREKTVM